MYARVARFEGLDPSRIDEGVAEMKQQMAASRSGVVPEGAPEGVQVLMETVRRFVELVDRDSGAGLGIVFCDTNEDMRRVDEAWTRCRPAKGRDDERASTSTRS